MSTPTSPMGVDQRAAGLTARGCPSPVWFGLLLAAPLTLALMAVGALFLLRQFNRRLAVKD